MRLIKCVDLHTLDKIISWQTDVKIITPLLRFDVNVELRLKQLYNYFFSQNRISENLNSDGITCSLFFTFYSSVIGNQYNIYITPRYLRVEYFPVQIHLTWCFIIYRFNHNITYISSNAKRTQRKLVHLFDRNCFKMN